MDRAGKQLQAPKYGTCSAVPPAGFEPALPPPEGGALSPELRGPNPIRLPINLGRVVRADARRRASAREQREVVRQRILGGGNGLPPSFASSWFISMISAVCEAIIDSARSRTYGSAACLTAYSAIGRP